MCAIIDGPRCGAPRSTGPSASALRGRRLTYSQRRASPHARDLNTRLLKNSLVNRKVAESVMLGLL